MFKISNLILIITLYFLFFLKTGCPIKSILGFPCPGCGITRSYLALLKMDLNEAFYYNPLFLVPIILALLMISKISDKYKYKIVLTLVALYLLVYFIRIVNHWYPVEVWF